MATEEADTRTTWARMLSCTHSMQRRQACLCGYNEVLEAIVAQQLVVV